MHMFQKIELAEHLVRAGFSYRHVGTITGLNAGTVKTYCRYVRESKEVSCPCGAESGHRGPCEWKYEFSLILRVWHLLGLWVPGLPGIHGISLCPFCAGPLYMGQRRHRYCRAEAMNRTTRIERTDFERYAMTRETPLDYLLEGGER